MRRINDRDSQFIFDDADTTIDEVAAEFPQCENEDTKKGKKQCNHAHVVHRPYHPLGPLAIVPRALWHVKRRPIVAAAVRHCRVGLLLFLSQPSGSLSAGFYE